VYLPNVVCQSEIPSDIHCLKAQQFRWTKGNLEAARKILPRVWPSGVSLAVKSQATMHLLSGLGYPMAIVLTLLSPLMLLAAGLHNMRVVWPLMVYYQCAFAGTFVYYVTSARALGGPWKQRVSRYPLFLMVFIGMSVNNTRAVLEALIGKRTPFERTPKFNGTSESAGATGRYRSKASWSVAWELLMAGFCLVSLVLAIVLKQWAALPFLLASGGGFSIVSAYSLQSQSLEPPTLRVLEGEPVSEEPILATVPEQESAA
jgi:hypothetical protein